MISFYQLYLVVFFPELEQGFYLQYMPLQGGTDMLAALLHLKIRQYSVSQIMQVLDAMVVLAGASVFGLGSALYAMIAIYAVCRVSDGILDGLNFFETCDHYF